MDKRPSFTPGLRWFLATAVAMGMHTLAQSALAAQAARKGRKISDSPLR